MLSPARRERILQEKTLYDLTRATGIHTPKLSLIERGLRNPSDRERRLISAALDLPEDTIFPQDIAPWVRQVG